MIAKRVPRPKGTSDFARLSRYVIDARGRVDPTTWETWARVSDYVLDTAHGGAKVGAVRVTNCHTDDDPAAAALEVRAVQARNTRAKGEKTYHLVVAFPPGERPTAAQLRDVEDTLCAAIGLADHQRISALHTDRDHLHLHVAINTVHPRTFRNVTPYYDHRRLMEACERLELKHGLARTNHGADAARAAGQSATSGVRPDGGAGAEPPIRGRAGDMEAHAHRESFRGWVLAHVAADLRAVARDGADWQDVHRVLARAGLEIRPRGAGLVIVPRADPGGAGGRRAPALAVRASDVDRSLSFGALTKRFGAFVPPTDEVRAMIPDRQYEAGPLAASPGTSDGAQAGRAPGDAAAGQGTTPGPTPAGARPAAPDTSALYAAYQRAREAAASARVAALAAEREQREAAGQRLAAAHAARRAAIRGAAHLDRAARREALRQLGAERAADWEAQRRRGAEARAGARAAHPLPTWEAFLEQAAARGDETALAALRQRRRREQHATERLTADLLAATDPERVRHVVYADLRPQPQKNGDVRYALVDGGRVTDCAPHVRVDQRTAGAVALALALASERFGGQALAVGGSDAFRRAVAEQAGRGGFAVRFADPALEAIRLDFARQAAQRRREEGASSPALRAFVEARNAMRERVPTLDAHRVWTSADVGEAEYRGQRTLADGSVVVLLRRPVMPAPASGTSAGGLAGDPAAGRPDTRDVEAPAAPAEMLVMPVTAEGAAVARTWRVGELVRADADGAVRGPHDRVVHRAAAGRQTATNQDAPRPPAPGATRPRGERNPRKR